MRLLLIEDDPAIRAPLGRYLREQGYAVDEADTAAQARELVQLYPYDAMVVDVMLGDEREAGFDLVRGWRRAGMSAPVLFLSARDGLDDRVEGLESGGDDYLVKPFHLREVEARLGALLRRAPNPPTMEVGWQDVTLDWSRRAVLRAGQAVHLTGKELGMIELLSRHPGRLYTREEIIERVWDAEFDAETNVVDVYVRNLRRKLGEGIVETVRGVGYRFPQI